VDFINITLTPDAVVFQLADWVGGLIDIGYVNVDVFLTGIA
jgi:hypothetical protein